MTSSRIKFSTASELLREDTFEAERLMELYTLADYKERQIARLRQEERELTQIINEQKEIISFYGASFDQSTESLTETLPQIVLKDTEIDVSRPNSARLPHENEERPKIAPSGSASELLDELQQALSNQPMREGHGMNISRLSHTFAQSRQNFFPVPSISNVLDNLEETTDFNQFFAQFPMSLILISGFYENNFPTESIISSIENWSPQRRQNFFIALFHDMQRSSSFMTTVFDISNVLTTFDLINIVECKLPKLFNCKRVSFLFYDSPNEELVLNKEKIKIRFPVKQGIFQRSLITQSPVQSNVDDSDVSPSDKAIIYQNKQVLIIPVLSIRSQFHVEGLLLFYDKFGGIQSSDYFKTSVIARCLAQIIPFLKKMEETKQRTNAFQKSVDTFVSLCTSSDLKTLIENIIESFTNFFNCEAVKIFKVSNKEKTYKEISSNNNRDNSDGYPFSLGIVGNCISNCRSINLSKPQFSENYDTTVDCYDENSFSSSLLIGTISKGNSICKWAIALYNKKDQLSFTPLDEESLSTICSHLLPLLENSWKEKKMKQAINQSKRQLTQAEALIDTIASLKNPTDIESMLVQMQKYFKSNTKFSNISLYSLDVFRKELVSHQIHPMEVVLLDSDNPIAECARTGKMIERENYVDNSVMIFYPIVNSTNSIIGVFLLRSGTSSLFNTTCASFNNSSDFLGTNSNLNLNIGLTNASSSNSNNSQIPPNASVNSLVVNFDSEDLSSSILAANANGNFDATNNTTSALSFLSNNSNTTNLSNGSAAINNNPNSILIHTPSNNSSIINDSNNNNNNNNKSNSILISNNNNNGIGIGGFNSQNITNNSTIGFNILNNSSLNGFNLNNNNSLLISNSVNNFGKNNPLNSMRNNLALNKGTSKSMNNKNNLVNLSTTCLDVNNNDDNDYSTTFNIKGETPNRQIVNKSSQLSCLTLNTFRSSGHIIPDENLESTENNFIDEDDNSENSETVLRMMKLWQKVSGSVLEAMQKHLFYSKRKQLIDHMNTAFFDNLFENSFRVWQEVQCLIDDFEDLEITDANIESPVITDLVFANTPELSEKTIQLIKTLQSLNAIDQSIFTSQKTENPSTKNDLTVLEEYNRGHSFLSTSAVDILSMDDGLIIENIISALNELAALQFLGINEREARDFIIELRSLHPPHKFTNWKLAVDNFQFAAFMMLNTTFGKSMSDVEMISTLLFLLSLYCDPPSLINNAKKDLIPMKRTRFTLETSGMFSTLSSFFTAYSWCKVQIFKTLPVEDQMNIWNTIDELEFSGTIDSFLGAPPALLLCCVARMSYMMRETGVTIKWFNKKIEEEMPPEILDEIDEIKRFQLDYESEAMINPMMEEAIKLDPNISSLLERYQSNCKSIIGKKTL